MLQEKALSIFTRHRFLLEELVKRDFKKKYKRSILGVGWSLLSPLLMLLVMKIVFSNFFARSISHFAIYLFSGSLFFGWFSESSNSGMRALMGNAGIFTKVNVPKYLFLLATNVQTLLNFFLTFLVYLLFCGFDGIEFSWRFCLLAYPILTMMLFNAGVGLILSAFFVFFRDIDYLWSVFTLLLMYGSAIFYKIDGFSPALQLAFNCNPVYRHILYVRQIVLDGVVPPLETHLTLLGFAVAAFLAGSLIYKRYNTRFLYYV